MAGADSQTEEQEHRQLLALKAAAQRLVAAQNAGGSFTSFTEALATLTADLKAYQARWPEPFLVHIAHLIRLAEGLLAAADPAAAQADRQQAFRPLLVALSRVGDQHGAAIESQQQDRPTAAAERFPLELVLVNLRSAFNVGSLVRTAECYGCAAVHVAGYTAGLDHPKVATVAMGCEADMPWSRNPDPLELCQRLKAAGTALVALETSPAATPIGEFRFPFPAALIVGNERFGIEPDVLAACDHVVRLPMFGKKNSLNVASATAITIHHARSAWRLHP